MGYKLGDQPHIMDSYDITQRGKKLTLNEWLQ